LWPAANKPDTHIKNVNYPRDFKADIITDIALAAAGDTCAKCGGKFVSMAAASKSATSSCWALCTVANLALITSIRRVFHIHA